MLASFFRRRLLPRIHKIPVGGTAPLRSIPGTKHLAHSYASTAVPNSQLCPATVSYLISCGLSPAAAAATASSQKTRIVSTGKANVVCALLRDYGFDDADVVRTVRSSPTILLVDPERILRPKLDFFGSLGFAPRKISTAPFLLARSLDRYLVPSIQFVRDTIGNDDGLRLAFSRVPRALMADVDKNMCPAVEALRHGGLTDAAISKLLVIKLSVLLMWPDRISQVFQELKAMGMHISDSRFFYCFGVMCSVTSGTWRRKLELFQSFGLSEGEVLKAFKTQPSIFLFADDNIRKKVQFLLDELKLGISDEESPHC